jgi:hypothetical protein
MQAVYLVWIAAALLLKKQVVMQSHALRCARTVVAEVHTGNSLCFVSAVHGTLYDNLMKTEIYCK